MKLVHKAANRKLAEDRIISRCGKWCKPKRVHRKVTCPLCLVKNPNDLPDATLWLAA